jgi:hypothetical protein
MSYALWFAFGLLLAGVTAVCGLNLGTELVKFRSIQSVDSVWVMLVAGLLFYGWLRLTWAGMQHGGIFGSRASSTHANEHTRDFDTTVSIDGRKE